MVLKKQTAAFRTAFLIGFLIGVVGMRLLLPLLIVSLTKQGLGLHRCINWPLISQKCIASICMRITLRSCCLVVVFLMMGGVDLAV